MKTKYDLRHTPREPLRRFPCVLRLELSPQHCEQLDHVGRGRSLELRPDDITDKTTDCSNEHPSIIAGSFAELSGAAVSMPTPKKLPKLSPLKGPRAFLERWSSGPHAQMKCKPKHIA